LKNKLSQNEMEK